MWPPVIIQSVIVIDKPLSLVGAGVGQSVIDGTAFGGPPFGFIVDITALTGNTKIEGFDIKTGDWNTGIHSSGGTDAAGKIEILNNHIISTNFDSGSPPSQQMQYGIIAGYLDVRKLVISGNEISDTYDNSILVELTDGCNGNHEQRVQRRLSFRLLHDLRVGTTISDPSQKVSGNTFRYEPRGSWDSGAAAIGVNPSTYYVGPARSNRESTPTLRSPVTPLQAFPDISVKGNQRREKIALTVVAGGVTNLDIFGNTISGTNGKGIQLFGHITGADIHDNTLTGLAQGMRLFTYESSYYPEGNTIENNQISGASAYLINYEGSAPVDLSGNWWGTSDGCHHLPKDDIRGGIQPLVRRLRPARRRYPSRRGMTIQAGGQCCGGWQLPSMCLPAPTPSRSLSTKSLQLIGADRDTTIHWRTASCNCLPGTSSPDINSQVVRDLLASECEC